MRRHLSLSKKLQGAAGAECSWCSNLNSQRRSRYLERTTSIYSNAVLVDGTCASPTSDDRQLQVKCRIPNSPRIQFGAFLDSQKPAQSHGSSTRSSILTSALYAREAVRMHVHSVPQNQQASNSLLVQLVRSLMSCITASVFQGIRRPKTQTQTQTPGHQQFLLRSQPSRLRFLFAPLHRFSS